MKYYFAIFMCLFALLRIYTLEKLLLEKEKKMCSMCVCLCALLRINTLEKLLLEKEKDLTLPGFEPGPPGWSTEPYPLS